MMTIEGPYKYAKFIKENDGHTLTSNEIRMLGLSRERAEDIVFDLIRQDANVKIFNNNYLFANDYYPDIINKSLLLLLLSFSSLFFI